VEPGKHKMREVGDEALLLAAHAPTLIARDRRAGVQDIQNAGHGIDCIVMDDGLQNGSVYKDLKIALVDSRRGFGNGEVIPAGPLRAPLPFQIGLVDCIVINRGSDGGDTESPVQARLKQIFPGPVISAAVEPSGDTSWLTAQRVHAYAGIAHPERFFMQLEKLGANIVARTAFADHHAFTGREARILVTAAQHSGATLVTTEKDFVRLTPGDESVAALRMQSRTLPVRLAFEDRENERLRALLATALKAK
jgi:tetraacyldisaccharide 4'-kinase